MRTAKTHFEQIPVAVVKKIAEEGFPALEEIRNDNVVLKVPAKKPEHRTRGDIRVAEMEFKSGFYSVMAGGTLPLSGSASPRAAIIGIRVRR